MHEGFLRSLLPPFLSDDDDALVVVVVPLGSLTRLRVMRFALLAFLAAAVVALASSASTAGEEETTTMPELGRRLDTTTQEPEGSLDTCPSELSGHVRPSLSSGKCYCDDLWPATEGYCGGSLDVHPDLDASTYLCDCAATTPSSSNNANIVCCMASELPAVVDSSLAERLRGITGGIFLILGTALAWTCSTQ